MLTKISSVPRQQQRGRVFSRNAMDRLPSIQRMKEAIGGQHAESKKDELGIKNFSGSAFSAQADGDKRRMAATAEEGTAPKPVEVNADANVRRSNSGNTKSGVTAGETAFPFLNLRADEGSSAGAVKQPFHLCARARSAEFSFLSPNESRGRG